MSGQFTGMDIAGVRQLATLLNNKAGEIRQITQLLTTQLQNTAWVGPDRERFLGDWQSAHVTALNNVIQGIEDAANRANQNAQEQESASNA